MQPGDHRAGDPHLLRYGRSMFGSFLPEQDERQALHACRRSPRANTAMLSSAADDLRAAAPAAGRYQTRQSTA